MNWLIWCSHLIICSVASTEQSANGWSVTILEGGAWLLHSDWSYLSFSWLNRHKSNVLKLWPQRFANSGSLDCSGFRATLGGHKLASPERREAGGQKTRISPKEATGENSNVRSLDTLFSVTHEHLRFTIHTSMSWTSPATTVLRPLLLMSIRLVFVVEHIPCHRIVTHHTAK